MLNAGTATVSMKVTFIIIVVDRRGLVGKIGEQRVVLLESLKNETKKYSDFELEAMIKHYSELVRKLKNLCKR